MSRSSAESVDGSPFARIRTMTSSRRPARRAEPTWAAHTYAASRSRTAERIATERSLGSTTFSSRLKVTSFSRRSANFGLCSRMLNGPRMLPKTLSTSSTTPWYSAGTSDLPVSGAILGMISSLPLYAGVALAPPVEIDNVREWSAADRPEAAHRVADRQDGVGVEAGRDPHRGGDLCFISDVARRQGRAERERTRRQQHILHRRVDRRAGRARRIGAVLETGHDPHRRFVIVVRQVFDSSLLTAILARIRSRRRCAARITRPDHLVEGFLVIDLHLLFDLRVFQHQKAPALRIPPARRGLPRQEDLTDQIIGHRVGLQPPHRTQGMDDLEKARFFGHVVLLRRFIAPGAGRASPQRRRWRSLQYHPIPHRARPAPL